MSDLSARLQALYDQVPATRCANSGECCVLTEEEFDNDYATMFPLYSAEYRNIVEFVKSNFSEERQRQLLDFTEERPRRCPFLGSDHRCTIYPIRPLICRTYAVMNHQTIAEAAGRSRGNLPEDWIRGFVLREGHMVCPRVTVAEPEKLERHARNLITSAYERELTRLSLEVEMAARERKRVYQRLTGRRSWPLRWTWGGFNSLCFSSLEWMRSHLGRYWKKAELVNGG